MFKKLLRWVGWGVGVTILFLMVQTALLKVQSYVIGLYSGIDVSVHQVESMERHIAEVYDQIDKMDFERFKFYEKRKLHLELEMVKRVKHLVEVLEDANQIGQ